MLPLAPETGISVLSWPAVRWRVRRTDPEDVISVTTRDLATDGSTSLGATFVARVAEHPDAEAFRSPGAGGWRSHSWAEIDRQARELAAGLLALGVAPEDRVALAASTRLEWIVADLAAMFAGAAITTIYPTTRPDEVGHILTDSGSVLVIAEDADQLAKVREHRDALPQVRHVVLIDGRVPEEDTDGWVLTLADLAQRGRDLLAERPDAVDASLAAVRPEHLATLIYTSGTTGKSKGVELTHANWLYVGRVTKEIGLLRPDHVQYLWLPLAHVFGKLLLSAQYEVGFATAVDGRVDKIIENLAVVRPTFMCAAPRIFEKLYARVTATAQAEGGAKAKIFGWAFDVGTRAVRLEAAGKPVPAVLAAQRKVADKLVFSKIKARLGGRIEYFVSGSAPLAPRINEWFAAAGITILEGYGLSESTGASTINRPDALKIGTVGHPMPGTEIRIAEDGEVLLRGPGIMRGYHRLPDKTAETLVAEGWLATGDIGELDERGRLKITDRKKDLVKTSGGKYIAPTAIEAALKAECPLLSQVLVVVEGRNYATALVTLDPDTAPGWASGHGVPDTDPAALSRSPEVRAEVKAAVERVNGGLSRWETVKDFAVLERDFTVDDGELTPSLKLKRRVIIERNADAIEGMYPAS